MNPGRKYSGYQIHGSQLSVISCLDLASTEFAEDTRHQVRSCSILPQALDNAVDSVKSVLPKGWQF